VESVEEVSWPAELYEATATWVTTVLTDAYDNHGNPYLSTVIQTDDSGAVVSRRESSMEYDARGRLVREVVVVDGDGGTPPNAQVTTTYDKSDYVLAKVTTTDSNSDRVIDATKTTAFGLDHKGRVLVSTITDDTDNDGVADSSERTSTTYDGKGRITRVWWLTRSVRRTSC